MRTYEALGCGAFYLTYHTPAHSSLFAHGKHLVWSKMPEETLRLVEEYLPSEEARRSIASSGQALVYQRDTYRHRAEKVVDLVSAIL